MIWLQLFFPQFYLQICLTNIDLQNYWPDCSPGQRSVCLGILHAAFGISFCHPCARGSSNLYFSEVYLGSRIGFQSSGTEWMFFNSLTIYYLIIITCINYGYVSISSLPKSINIGPFKTSVIRVAELARHCEKGYTVLKWNIIGSDMMNTYFITNERNYDKIINYQTIESYLFLSQIAKNQSLNLKYTGVAWTPWCGK